MRYTAIIGGRVIPGAFTVWTVRAMRRHLWARIVPLSQARVVDSEQAIVKHFMGDAV